MEFHGSNQPTSKLGKITSLIGSHGADDPGRIP